jgi:hypothetical protein
VPTRIVLEGPQLEPLLAQVSDEYGGRAKIVSANKIRSGGLAGFFAKERFELSVEVGDDGADEEAADTLLDLVDAREDRYEALDEPTSPAAPPTVAPVRAEERTVTPLAIPVLTPPRASVVSTSGAAFAEVMAGLQDDLANARHSSAPARRFENRPNGARPQPPSLAGQPLAADLAALGLPAGLAAKARGDEPYNAVLNALADLPGAAPVPDRPGDVFVVAGELSPAARTAQWAARTLRLDPAQVLLAGPTVEGTTIIPSRRITGPADAERRAKRMHRADVPWVVVLDAPLGVDAGWVEELIGGLGATAVWATVDATRKPGDTANHLRSLGKVDALAVYAADVCADPGTVLALPAPIALLDGVVANPHEWAALLSRRLTEHRAAPAGRTGREAVWR